MEDILSVNIKSASFERAMFAKDDDELKELTKRLCGVDVVRYNVIRRELVARKERRRQFSIDLIEEWNKTTQELHKKLTGGWKWDYRAKKRKSMTLS